MPRPQQPTGSNGSNWTWWQLNTTTGSVVRRTHVQLSRYVVNLRAGLPQGAVQSHQKKLKAVTARETTVNLLRQPQVLTLSVSRCLARIAKRTPQLPALSLWLPLELTAYLFDYTWLPVVAFLIRLSGELLPILREVACDVREFTRLVGLVAWFPIRGLGFLLPKLVPAGFGVPTTPAPFYQVASFGLLVFLATLTLKGAATLAEVHDRGNAVQTLAQGALSDFKAGAASLSAGDAAGAVERFSYAQRALEKALTQLEAIPMQVRAAASLLPGTPGSLPAVEKLLRAAGELSQAGVAAARGWGELVGSAGALPTGELTPQLQTVERTVSEVVPSLDLALSLMGGIGVGSLPEQAALAVAALQEQITDLRGLLQQAVDLPGFLRDALGNPEGRTYVVLFQNVTELRPTGGFAGSLAIVRLEHGTVTSVQIPGGGPYDYQGSLRRVVAPPEPLRLVRGTWQLQDANWFFDFPTSARNVLWFLEASGGGEADGVIALTSDTVVDLLKLTGPLHVERYGKTLTAENFMRETQSAVELSYDRTQNRPKQFIADLAPLLLNRLLELDAGKLSGLATQLAGAFSRREIQVYLRDPLLQERLSRFGWSGEVRATPLDYLALVRANIGGGKTDRVVRESVTHRVEISPLGDVVDTISLTRTHSGRLGNVFEGRRNVTYLRFYVPLGSKLLSTTGFTPPSSSYLRQVPAGAEDSELLVSVEQETGTPGPLETRVTEEFGKTVFANWLALSPGDTATVSLSYQLPIRLPAGGHAGNLHRYAVLYQGQAGVQAFNRTTELVLPGSWRTSWVEAASKVARTASGFTVSQDWDGDGSLGAIFEKPDND